MLVKNLDLFTQKHFDGVLPYLDGMPDLKKNEVQSKHSAWRHDPRTYDVAAWKGKNPIHVTSWERRHTTYTMHARLFCQLA